MILFYKDLKSKLKIVMKISKRLGIEWMV